MKMLADAPKAHVEEVPDGLTIANPSLRRDGKEGRVIRRASGL